MVLTGASVLIIVGHAAALKMRMYFYKTARESSLL